MARPIQDLDLPPGGVPGGMTLAGTSTVHALPGGRKQGVVSVLPLIFFILALLCPPLEADPPADHPELRIGHHELTVWAHAYYPGRLDGLAGDIPLSTGAAWDLGETA
jgi:hypothetical protein